MGVSFNRARFGMCNEEGPCDLCVPCCRPLACICERRVCRPARGVISCLCACEVVATCELWCATRETCKWRKTDEGRAAPPASWTVHVLRMCDCGARRNLWLCAAGVAFFFTLSYLCTCADMLPLLK